MNAVFRIGSLFLISALAVVSTATRLTGQEPAPERPDFSGPWQLNVDLSDDPREKMQSMGRGSRGGEMRGGGRRGGGLSGGFGRGRMGGGDLEEARASMEKAKQLLMEAPTTMVITQEAGTVSMTDQDGRVRTLYTDGSGEQPEGEEMSAKWEGSRLVSETEVGKSAKVIETYQLEPTTGQLLVDLRLEGGPGGRSLALHRVYEPAVE